MENLKSFFSENEWNLVSDINTNGKQGTWIEYAFKYNIKPDSSPVQRLKAANDIYRKYLKKAASFVVEPKILIYDIETAKINFELWWSGKQFVNGNNSLSDPKIITISYKWLGSDKIEYVKWDKDKSDQQLMKDFLTLYNQADMVIGINNDKFDNRYINARAAKYGLEVNTLVKSLDVQKQCRKLFRLPSYSMKYLGRYFELGQQKMKVHMQDIWEDIMYGTQKESEEAMDLLIEYNRQDIATTEALYLKLRKYLKHPIHLGVLQDQSRCSSPVTGSEDVSLFKTTFTTAGTVQRILKCNETGNLFKVSNSTYLKSL